MVARGVAPDNEDRVALVEIFEHDSSRTGAKRGLIVPRSTRRFLRV